VTTPAIGSPTAEQLHSIRLGTEPICLVATPSVAKARSRRQLFTVTGCLYRRLVEQYEPGPGKHRWDALQLGSLESVRAGVLYGLGAALLPRVSVLGPLRSGKLVELPWAGPDQLEIHGAWHGRCCPTQMVDWLVGQRASLPREHETGPPERSGGRHRPRSDAEPGRSDG